MAFVSVPKDLSKVKTKLAFNLTRRQLICFSIAGAIGIPAYFLMREPIGTSAAVLVMIALMMPLFFLAMYEKDGQPAEVVLRNMLRAKLWPATRPYRTENLYEYLETAGQLDEATPTINSPKEADNLAKQKQTAKATGTTSAKKRRAGTKKRG
jgi:hypothetical protein